jgi:hypothetical protein
MSVAISLQHTPVCDIKVIGDQYSFIGHASFLHSESMEHFEYQASLMPFRFTTLLELIFYTVNDK